MRLKKIDSVDAANEFLISYQKEFNQLFALPHNFTTDAFEKQIDNDKINEVLAIVSQKKPIMVVVLNLIINIIINMLIIIKLLIK